MHLRGLSLSEEGWLSLNFSAVLCCIFSWCILVTSDSMKYRCLPAMKNKMDDFSIRQYWCLCEDVCVLCLWGF